MLLTILAITMSVLAGAYAARTTRKWDGPTDLVGRATLCFLVGATIWSNFAYIAWLMGYELEILVNYERIDESAWIPPAAIFVSAVYYYILKPNERA